MSTFLIYVLLSSLNFNGSGAGDVYAAMTYAARLSMRPGVAKAMVLASCRLVHKATLLLNFSFKFKRENIQKRIITFAVHERGNIFFLLFTVQYSIFQLFTFCLFQPIQFIKEKLDINVEILHIFFYSTLIHY